MLKQSSPSSDTACPPGNIACARNHALQASGANHYRTSGHCSRVVSNEASRPAVNFINMRWICHCPVLCYIQTTLVHGQVMENSIKYIMIKLTKRVFLQKNVAFLLLFLLKKIQKAVVVSTGSSTVQAEKILCVENELCCDCVVEWMWIS